MCKNCDDYSLSRRNLMLGAGVALAAGALPLSASFAAAEEPVQNAISPDEALERIMKGNERYAANTSQRRDFSAGRAARASVQYPIAAILSCADSRVAPELAFDQGPGDLFIVRVAGNFVDDSGLASLEYAVAVLNVPLLMVLGHSNCGAVDATIKVVKEHAELPGHLPILTKAIGPAVVAAHARHPSDLLAAAIEENVKINVKRMHDDKPILSDALAAKKIAVVGGVYDLATGKVNLI
ncbi:MAG TPA: carbonic anhydrase [Methyloceanibacter sp.]|nr:carbonic anhydrase [Methyloceanibacter sp.]